MGEPSQTVQTIKGLDGIIGFEPHITTVIPGGNAWITLAKKKLLGVDHQKNVSGQFFDIQDRPHLIFCQKIILKYFFSKTAVRQLATKSCLGVDHQKSVSGQFFNIPIRPHLFSFGFCIKLLF